MRKCTQRKRKDKDTKGMPMGRQGRKGGYVIRQPITFETSMDEWMNRICLTMCDHMVSPIIQRQNKKKFLPNNQVPM